MKKFFTKEVKIAITVILSFCVLFWGIEYLKGVNLFKPANFYYVQFNNVAGLIDSAPVTINGYQVGQVREIKYDYKTGTLNVMLGMEKELNIPTGTKALLVTDVLGTAQIELDMAQSDTFYEVGATLEGANATGLMDQVSDELLPGVAELMPKIDSILTSLNTIVSSPALKQSVDRIDAITSHLEASTRQLSASLPAIIKNVDGITANLDSLTSSLNTLSADINNMPIDSTVANLHSASENLNAMTAKLNDTNSSLGLLLNDRGLYDHLDGAVMSLDSLLIDVKENPKRYVTIKVF